ncbi:hypothetical protein EDB19DRAFT_1642806, partial [Suillus lakei]
LRRCGNVIRWDIPQHMASWTQSRGRARRKKSSFVLMLSTGLTREFEKAEREMTALYQAHRASRPTVSSDEEALSMETSLLSGCMATLNPLQAVSYLNHFCAVIPNSGHLPVYDIDPTDMPEGWHSFGPRATRRSPKS